LSQCVLSADSRGGSHVVARCTASAWRRPRRRRRAWGRRESGATIQMTMAAAGAGKGRRARPESRQRRRRAPERRSLAGGGGSGIKLIWTALAATPARFLGALAEQEMVERSRRRFERHLGEARPPPAKTLDAFDFDAAPMISKARVQAVAGDAWIEKGWRVLFTGTTDLVQELKIARRDLALEAGIAKLDKYHPLILDGHRLSEPRASKATPRRRQAGASTVGIPINRSIGHIGTNALSINADQRRAPPALAAFASDTVIGANKPCDAPARRLYSRRPPLRSERSMRDAGSGLIMDRGGLVQS
jgi:hypothetical protein